MCPLCHFSRHIFYIILYLSFFLPPDLFCIYLMFFDLVTKLKFSSLIAQESNAARHVLGKGKLPLLGKLAILGRMWNHVPKNQLQLAKSCSRDYIGKRRRDYLLGTGLWGPWSLMDSFLICWWWDNQESISSTTIWFQPSGVIISVNSKFRKASLSFWPLW